jgi:Zn-dependent protease
LADLVVSLAVLLLSLTIHETAHALAADRLGDPTARRLGRVSLNPLVHIDFFGTLVLPLLAFATKAPLIGWAKPVPVDPRNLAHPRRDFVLIAAAGPISNLLLAVVAAAGARAALGAAGPLEPPPMIASLLWSVVTLNLLLAIFNLVPVPPLDGGNILLALLPRSIAPAVAAVRPFGFLVLYALLLTGALSAIVVPPLRLLAGILSP